MTTTLVSIEPEEGSHRYVNNPSKSSITMAAPFASVGVRLAFAPTADGRGDGRGDGAPGLGPEESTSGYLSESPKNTHTPNIWYNDGASRVDSLTSATESSFKDMPFIYRNVHQKCPSTISAAPQQQKQQQQQQQQRHHHHHHHHQQTLSETYVVRERSSQQHHFVAFDGDTMIFPPHSRYDRNA